MDTTIIVAAAALLGSVVGAAATIGTTWITQRTQTAHSKIEAKLRDREALYGEFITEASRLTLDALTHQLEQPTTFVKLYGILERIRLVAADPVLASAEACCRQIVDQYAKPTMTIDQIRAAFENGQIDPIEKFSTVCRMFETDLLPWSIRAPTTITRRLAAMRSCPTPRGKTCGVTSQYRQSQRTRSRRPCCVRRGRRRRSSRSRRFRTCSTSQQKPG